MIFLQKKRFHGQQEFRLLEGDQLRVTVRGSGREHQYSVSLREIDPHFSRLKTRSYGYLFAAIPAALFTAFMVLGIVSSGPRGEPALPIQLAIMTFVFGGIALLCFRENSRKGNDLAVFYHRFSGKPILTPWYRLPNPAAFDGFIAELTSRIEDAVQRPADPAAVPRGTMAGEILALKKLVDDGVLSSDEFERAKGKLLETAGERRAIGFGG